MNLIQLIEEHQRSMILNKPFNPNIEFKKDVPSWLTLAWKKRTEAQEALMECLIEARCIVEKRKLDAADPLAKIGMQIEKKSRKPFKGGDTVVVATSIIAHPNLPDSRAYTYEFTNKSGTVEESYIEIRQVVLSSEAYEV